jgi:hypothetical protein
MYGNIYTRIKRRFPIIEEQVNYFTSEVIKENGGKLDKYCLESIYKFSYNVYYIASFEVCKSMYSDYETISESFLEVEEIVSRYIDNKWRDKIHSSYQIYLDANGQFRYL